MAKKISNPFVTTGYAGAEYFCDRESETADLIRLLTNGNNVALVSPRRYGKTDLIRHCFAQREIADHYHTFIVDIYSTKSVADMVNRLGASILDTLKPRGRATWEKFIDIVSSVRANISFDINGMPTWSLGVGDISSPNTTLEQIFSYLSAADKPCLVAIDEFQQITHYSDTNIEAALRTEVQYCTNAHFIFSGSQQHLMGQMFLSPARPFYQSVTLYNLPLLPEDKYCDFCIRMFENYGKNLETDVPHIVFASFEGITYYMQRIMNELFSHTAQGETCVPTEIDNAVQNITANAAMIYEDLMYQLPRKQAETLVAIAKEGKARNITSSRFVKKHSLTSASSVKSAVPALLEKGLVTHETGTYQVYDKFLELWLSKRI